MNRGAGSSYERRQVKYPLADVDIIVFENEYVPLKYVSEMLQTTAPTLKKHLHGTKFMIAPTVKNSVYKIGGTTYQNLVNRKGIEWLLRRYMNWKEESVQDALDTIYRERETDDNDSLSQKMDQFLKKVDERIGQDAIRYYMQSKQFQEDRKKLLAEQVDKLIPEVRKKLREEFEEEIRKQVEFERNQIFTVADNPQVETILLDTIISKKRKTSHTGDD